VSFTGVPVGGTFLFPALYNWGKKRIQVLECVFLYVTMRIFRNNERGCCQKEHKKITGEEGKSMGLPMD